MRKFSSFRFITLSVLAPRPPISTGWAAPMLVPGAIAAISAASVTKQPRACGGSSRGSYIHDRGHCWRKQGLYNIFCGTQQSSWCVKLNDQATVVLTRSERHCPLNVACGDGTDCTADLDEARGFGGEAEWQELAPLIVIQRRVLRRTEKDSSQGSGKFPWYCAPTVEIISEKFRLRLTGSYSHAIY